MPDSQYVFKKYLLYKTIFFLELSFFVLTGVLVVVSRGYSLVAVHRLLIVMASLVVEHRL